jgi:hypothetical protein
MRARIDLLISMDILLYVYLERLLATIPQPRSRPFG